MKTLGSKILIINIGSASKKYSVFDGLDEIVFFHFEKSADDFILTVKGQGRFEKDKVVSNDYENSIEFVSNYLSEKLKIEIEDIYAVSFRIVAPGEFFLNHKEIDENYLNEMEKVKSSSGMHLLPVINEFKKVQKIYKEQKKVGVSDSAFHNTKLEESKYYGISKELQDNNEYKRFGYHGISVESVKDLIIEKEGKIPDKVLVCHLGGGVSFTALRNGKSIDNSMGFSPLEGPMMATRSGNIDATLIQEIIKTENLDNEGKQDEFLFEKSGLLGLSGIASDLRVLKTETFKGNKDAKFAINVYIFNLIKEMMKMTGVLKGIDTLVFTGTIGFRADFIRELILDELRWFGINFDIEKNSESDSNSKYFYIHSPDSKIKVLVCETDEMQMMAKISAKIV